MADQHPIWRGHLRLALVSCPVALYSARHAAAELHFHYINPKTGHRVRMVTLDAGTDEELRRADLVKGYEFEKDTYVLLDEGDFDRARIESSTLLNVDKFVPQASIDPIYFENSYYLVPDGDAGQDVYAVLREAITKCRQVALSRVVIARRERAVAILPMATGLVLHTLHDERDLHDSKPFFAPLSNLKTDPAMVTLAKQLINRQLGRFDPADMEDRYEARLRAVIDAKLAGDETMAPEPEPEPSNVIDLMAALKRSLGQSVDPAPARTNESRPNGKKSKAAKLSSTISTPKKSVVKPHANRKRV